MSRHAVRNGIAYVRDAAYMRGPEFEESVGVTNPLPAAIVGRLGVNDACFFYDELVNTAIFDSLMAAGINWERDTFYLNHIQAVDSSHFDWSATDAIVAASAKSGINLLIVLVYSPPWASSDPGSGHAPTYPPTLNSDFANFCSAAVNRYKAGGAFWGLRTDLTPNPVAAYEIWNEPWGQWDWQPNPDPNAYAAMVAAAGAAIRSADSTVSIVVAGDRWQGDGTTDWLPSLLSAPTRISSYVDAWSVHPYPTPLTNSPNVNLTSPTSNDYGRVTLTNDVAASNGVVRPVWITEIGWTTPNPVGSNGVTEATQAQYLSDAFGIALGDWSSFVAKTFVYSYQLDGGPDSDYTQRWGLLRLDGSRKPSWSAITSAWPTQQTSAIRAAVNNVGVTDSLTAVVT